MRGFFEGWTKREKDVFFALGEAYDGGEFGMVPAGQGLVEAGPLLEIALKSRYIIDGKLDLLL